MKLERLEKNSKLFDAFKRHLNAAGLPTDDLFAEPAIYYALEPSNDDARAFGGLLSLGSEALLRSVVVPDSQRRHGYGGVIVSGLSALATQAGAKRLWLLTTTAAKFFERQGWQTVKRGEAPSAVASTRQFSSVCPDSAVLMCHRAG